MAEARQAVVTSRDGTQIAYFTSGDGPPLLLIAGTTADHNRWAPLLPHLEPHVTVYAMDRRGRGHSGDSSDYHIDREYEDIVAVAEAIASQNNSTVALYGHSFGGLCAFGAAPQSAAIGKVAAYEGWPKTDPSALAFAPGIDERLDDLLARGDREGVVVTFFREVLAMTDEQLDMMRAQPSWAARVAAAHTIRRESDAERHALLDPKELARITVPVLLLVGDTGDQLFAKDASAVAAALPDARVSSLPGQGHAADIFAPEVVAERLLPFVTG